jgi:hypothetical protein
VNQASYRRWLALSQKDQRGGFSGTPIPNAKRPVRKLKLIDPGQDWWPAFAALPRGLMLAPVAPYPAGLLEHHSQGEACVRAMVAIAAAHWILQQ